MAYVFRNCYSHQTRYQFLLETNPAPEWYEGNRPGAALLRTSSRRDETILEILRSGRTRTQMHVAGLKVYSHCPNCNVIQATPCLHFELYYLP
ncbi:hypothetical protein TNCV_1380231 [Trichonephila clavipes]|nr:hypothetical protein TNCV_1380231 [Trichonephila clavipes]